MLAIIWTGWLPSRKAERIELMCCFKCSGSPIRRAANKCELVACQITKLLIREWVSVPHLDSKRVRPDRAEAGHTRVARCTLLNQNCTKPVYMHVGDATSRERRISNLNLSWPDRDLLLVPLFGHQTATDLILSDLSLRYPIDFRSSV